MIKFLSLELKNFVVFEHIKLDFSVSDSRPLTLIRGENEAGKTTLMRGFQWALFGARGLPKATKTGGGMVRPTWVENEEIETKAQLVFSVLDGESQRANKWQITRRQTTSYSSDSGVQEKEETIKILKESGNTWAEGNDNQMNAILRRYFPRETRGFYFVDADEADKFVGGQLSQFEPSQMRNAVTGSLRQLLGISTLEEAHKRIKTLKNKLEERTSHAANDEELAGLQGKVTEADEAENALKEKIAGFEGELDDAQNKRDGYASAIDLVAEDQAEIREIQERIQSAKDAHHAAKMAESATSNVLASRFAGEELHAALAAPLFSRVVNELMPLRKKGLLPPQEVTLLPRLLEEGMCVCGRPLDEEHSEAREFMEERFNESVEYARSHSYLDHVLTASERMQGVIENSWSSLVEDELVANALSSEAVLDLWDAVSDVEKELKDYGSAVDSIGVGENLTQRDEWQTQVNTLTRTIETQKQLLPPLAAGLRSAREKRRVAMERREDLVDELVRLDAYQILEGALSTAASRVERDQVPEVSGKLNDIFREVIQATNESNFSEVGIESDETKPTNPHGLYVLDGNRRPQSLALANGASRRALAVAYVLALTESTGSRVPFVADSLLHSLSGKVKLTLLKFLIDGERVEQPVIFCTRDDVTQQAVTDLLLEYSGASATLTSQTKVLSNGVGEVMRFDSRTKNRRCSVLCDCAINEFCEVCELVGDKDSQLSSRVGS